ncbi:MAG: hypothetical protein ACK482_08955 [Aphanizomenon sp.]
MVAYALGKAHHFRLRRHPDAIFEDNMSPSWGYDRRTRQFPVCRNYATTIQEIWR